MYKYNNKSTHAQTQNTEEIAICLWKRLTSQSLSESVLGFVIKVVNDESVSDHPRFKSVGLAIWSDEACRYPSHHQSPKGIIW